MAGKAELRGMGEEIQIGKALQLFLRKSRLQQGIRAMQIEALWEELMGKTIARYTDKIQIVQHTLFITTSVAPLKNELLYQKNRIRERVNEALGEEVIREVVIQ
jgi:hypothetical protein